MNMLTFEDLRIKITLNEIPDTLCEAELYRLLNNMPKQYEIMVYHKGRLSYYRHNLIQSR
jgi:hypothetical protein